MLFAAASCGAAGQRCMAISVAVLVGEAGDWVGEIQNKMKDVLPGNWDDPASQYGPLIFCSCKRKCRKINRRR
jgi:malonate-semialdehyde dehydrogenase (acetylating)/methylmalonate-semialdehyde dehydrogenase